MSPGQVLAAVAARDLESVLTLPDRPLTESAWQAMATLAHAGRLWGEVAAAVASGDLPATDAQSEAAHEAHAAAMATVVELEAMALDVVDLLESSGLQVRLLKGMANAHLDHPDPANRSFDDVDLLVEPGRFEATLDALAVSGWQRDLPERRARFDERFGKDGTLQRDGSGRVDLHRTLTLGPFGLWIDLDELWAGYESFGIAGRPVTALDAPGRLLHACYASVLSDPCPRLSLLRDVALLARRGPDVVAGALALAAGWHGEVVVRTGCAMSTARLGLPSSPVGDSPPGTGAGVVERLALRSYDSQGGSNTRLLLAGTIALVRWRDRVAYLHGLVLPSRAYRVARERAGRPSEWRRGASDALRLRPR